MLFFKKFCEKQINPITKQNIFLSVNLSKNSSITSISVRLRRADSPLGPTRQKPPSGLDPNIFVPSSHFHPVSVGRDRGRPPPARPPKQAHATAARQ